MTVTVVSLWLWRLCTFLFEKTASDKRFVWGGCTLTKSFTCTRSSERVALCKCIWSIIQSKLVASGIALRLSVSHCGSSLSLLSLVRLRFQTAHRHYCCCVPLQRVLWVCLFCFHHPSNPTLCCAQDMAQCQSSSAIFCPSGTSSQVLSETTKQWLQRKRLHDLWEFFAFWDKWLSCAGSSKASHWGRATPQSPPRHIVLFLQLFFEDKKAIQSWLQSHVV